MEVHGQLTLGHYELEIPFKSNYEVLAKCTLGYPTGFSIMIFLPKLNTSRVADSPHLKHPKIAIDTCAV